MEHLAAETLLEIFHYYLHLPTIRTWTKPTICHSKHTFTSPLPLTHVSRFWRQVACNDPRLWSSIFVIGPTPTQIPLVQLWLSRTKNFTLRIEFLERYCESTSKELTAASKELMNVFWEKKRFWAIVDFEFTSILDEYSTWTLREAIADPDPSLNIYSARIIDNRKGHKDLTLPLWRTIPWCPNLHRLEVGPLFFPTLNANLRELICHGHQTRAQILGFLASCPRLEKFEGTVAVLPNEENPWTKYSRGALVLAHLRHLCLTSFGEANSLAIYSALTCPRLEYFSAELNGGNSDCSREIYDLIDRSQCRLRTLKGVNVGYSTISQDLDHMVHFFSHPKLQNLETLLVYRPNEVFFHALTLPSDTHLLSTHPPLLPHLQNLDIIVYNAHSGIEFSEMVVSRFAHLSRIRLCGTPGNIILLEGRQVWNFPGVIVDVVHDFRRREVLWNEYTLFGGAWNQMLMDQAVVRTGFYRNQFFFNRFGRGDEWYKADRFRVIVDGRGGEEAGGKGVVVRLSDGV